jgi:hypothetical protein
MFSSRACRRKAGAKRVAARACMPQRMAARGAPAHQQLLVLTLSSSQSAAVLRTASGAPSLPGWQRLNNVTLRNQVAAATCAAAPATCADNHARRGVSQWLLALAMCVAYNTAGACAVR